MTVVLQIVPRESARPDLLTYESDLCISPDFPDLKAAPSRPERSVDGNQEYRSTLLVIFYFVVNQSRSGGLIVVSLVGIFRLRWHMSMRGLCPV